VRDVRAVTKEAAIQRGPRRESLASEPIKPAYAMACGGSDERQHQHRGKTR
jgi:hypothetical protein